MKKNNKIIIVGAGPGGLTAGMLLSSKGYDVDIYEKEDKVGGRNGFIESNGFKFDIGPTFLMLKPVLDKIFKESNEDVNKHLTFYDLEPMYNLVFKNKSLKLSRNHKKTREEIKTNFPGEEKGFDLLLKREKKRFDVAYPCLEKDYSKFFNLFNKDLLKFIPKLSFPNSMHTELGKYFKNEDLKMAFTFQSKYLGMSPWNCPAAFMIIPYIEHNFGIYHVKGGLSEISQAMAKVIIKKGGKINLNTPVKKIERKKIILENNEIIKADKIIINADVGYAMKNLLKKKDMKKKDFSCSIFMMYLGISKKVNLDFHTIFFSDDYKKFIENIFTNMKLTDDFSMYIRNASILDKTIAPKNCSNLYVLIPVPNNKSKINWDKIKKEFRDKVIEKIKLKTKIDIKKYIMAEHIITPKDWEEKYNVFLGATFNLAHNLTQMLYFRPHNQLEKDLYLVGGGTHPGSGLPTIYQSGIIASELIQNEKK
jgi:phytoene desaturase